MFLHIASFYKKSITLISYAFFLQDIQCQPLISPFI